MADKEYSCPCCGSSMDKPLGYRGRGLLGPRQQRLFNIVKKSPDGITTDAIFERMYGWQERDPRLISVMAHQINKKLRKFGLRISAQRGHVYRLYDSGQPMESL